jgi:hypothetical protein
MQQLHKKFTNKQVSQFIQRYLNKEIKGKYLQSIPGIKKTRFFALVKQYQQSPETFSIQYHQTSVHRTIDKLTEINILKELSVDQHLITNKDVPLYHYNYSYIKERLLTQYKQRVSVPTIIDRAKKHNFYIKRHRKKKVHDREVLTCYAGELIQHDASIHLFAPDAQTKWWLITSLDKTTAAVFCMPVW